MTVGIVATLKVKAESGKDFEKAFGALQAAVREKEPGNLLYELFKEDASTYVVMEKYASKDAMDAHGKSDHFRKLGAALGPFMAGAPDIKRLEFVS